MGLTSIDAVVIGDDEPQVPRAGASAWPAGQSDRITAIDVLRGFALLGILVMNIQAFAMIDAAYTNPSAYGDLTGGNFRVWYFSHLLADQKMMTIFSMLFGAGIVLMTARAEAATGRSAALHYRRMGVLLAFGLMHGYLLWFGDILYSYAMCGMLAYLFRNFRPPWLFVFGLLFVTIPWGLAMLFAWSVQYWKPEDLVALKHDAWLPTGAMIAEKLAAYRGNWWDEIVHRAPTTLQFQTFFFILFFAWRVLGLMLIGMALFKLGILTAQRSAATYLTMLAAGVLIGIPIVAYGAHRNLDADWDMRYSFFHGGHYNYWGSMIVAVGWIGLIMLVCKSAFWRNFTHPLAAVGQMAFTNYLMHTLICTTIFYGRGFGLYGRVERIGQIGIVFAVWLLQLVLSPIWLYYFRFGPAEWLWRSLSYGKWQPMFRSPGRADASFAVPH